MVFRRFNNILLVIIILCSTSIYEFSMLGPLKKISELTGIFIIMVLFALHFVYDKRKRLPQHFVLPIVLIISSLITSMFMARYVRAQSITDTLLAQSPMYYYFLYFLMPYLRIKPEDLQKIFIGFGILYVTLYLLQFFLYPKIIFDAYVRFDRGTIRIYLAGSAYLSVTYLIYLQRFLRFNHVINLIWIFVFFSIFILSGGRQTIALMVLIAVIFIITGKSVKSRIVLLFLGIIGSLSIYLIFRDIFQVLFLKAKYDAALGNDYIRFKAAQFYLTDFFKNSFSYITGNGMYAEGTSYGNEINRFTIKNQFYLGDIGIIGNYAIYGLFFIIGVTIIFIRAWRIRLAPVFIYIKYLFGVILLSILTGGAFTQSHFICFIVCILYIIDVSQYTVQLEDSNINKK